MTVMLLIMTVIAGVFGILYFTSTCSTTCTKDQIEGYKSSVVNQNIEILSYDACEQVTKVEKDDDGLEKQNCPKPEPPINCLTTWRLIEVLVLILIVILVVKGTIHCIFGSHKKLSEKI